MMQDYMQFKLVTGEVLIGVLVDSRTDAYWIACPMQVRTQSVMVGPGKIVDHLSASPYMRLTDDLVYDIDRIHVISCKLLNDFGINLYVGLLDEHYDVEQLMEAGIYDLVRFKYEDLRAKRRNIETLDNLNQSLDLIKKIVEQKEQPSDSDLDPKRIIH